MNDAKVMTLEDVRTADLVCLEVNGQAWEDSAVHYRPGSVYIGFTTPENVTFNLVEYTYDCTWRCWTKKPEKLVGVRW